MPLPKDLASTARNHAARRAVIAAVQRGRRDDALVAGEPLDVAEIARRFGHDESAIEPILAALEASGDVARDGDGIIRAC